MAKGQALAAKKRTNPNRDIIQIRADPAWIDAVTAEAELLGLSISAYIRLAVNERMQRSRAERPAAPDKPRKLQN
jgi:hypothetical protein